MKVGEVGHRVGVRTPNCTWERGTVVKLNRAGICSMYEVRGVHVLLDHNRGATYHDLPSDGVRSLGEDRKEVRYWTSGTPCMRSGDSVDAHARRNESAQQAVTSARLRMTSRPKIGPYAGGSEKKRCLAAAETRAAELLATYYSEGGGGEEEQEEGSCCREDIARAGGPEAH